jgi:hypothetical protein
MKAHGEVNHHLRSHNRFFGDGVDATFGRSSDDLVAPAAEDGNGLRTD